MLVSIFTWIIPAQIQILAHQAFKLSDMVDLAKPIEITKLTLARGRASKPLHLRPYGPAHRDGQFGPAAYLAPRNSAAQAPITDTIACNCFNRRAREFLANKEMALARHKTR